MIRFIWQNWWRRKERFILLIIGAFIVSAGFTYLIGLSETNKGTIVDTLQQEWSAPYDIVVRPQGSRSITEDKNLLEPNYLSGLHGGIRMDQYEAIKSIPGVEVAAPIAMIGYGGHEVKINDAELSVPGIYRKSQKMIVNNGVDTLEKESVYYFPYNVDWNYYDKYGYGAGAPSLEVGSHSYFLLAGIDPIQEAKLVGLDDAIVSLGSSRYFNDMDEAFYDAKKEYYEIPIIVNNQAFIDVENIVTFDRLTLPIDKDTADSVMEAVKEQGAFDYLETLEGEYIQSFTFTGEQVFHRFISDMTGVDWETGEVMKDSVPDKPADERENIMLIVFQPSPLNYQTVMSPFSDRWPYAYQVVPIHNADDSFYAKQDMYREPRLYNKENVADSPTIKPNWIGFYDSSNLDIALDPKSELPMETYRPASAELVIDPNDEPINPPAVLKPTDDPYDFLTEPPGMLTTIEAAEQILGDEPISAIRIKVAGVADMSDESQVILERVANEIEEKTGLITDITLGSSPQLTLAYVPGVNDESEIGWIQQPWVNIGSSISIFRETKLGFAGLVASVIVVAVVYVWSSGLISLLARRKEFAVLLSVGWRPNQLSRMLVLEAFILGLFVALISWLILGLVYMSGEATISLVRFFLTGCFGLLIYLLGAIVPSLLARNIAPYEAMRTGEITKTSRRFLQTRGLISMAFNHYMGKWKRSFLSVFSISLPTALLALFLYITFRLQGIMYTTLLGEFITLEIGPIHYVAIIVSLIIAILTTAEIMWQNVAERRDEIALLQAIGWRRSRVRNLILMEGLFSGIFAAVIGLTLAFLMMWGLYREFPTEEIGFILATGLIPIIIGTIGAIIPAERAARMDIYQGMRGNISNRKAVEKRLKWVVATTSFLLIGLFIYTMIQVAPNIETSSDSNVQQEYSPTEGDIVLNVSEDEEANKEVVEEENTVTDMGNYLYEINEGEDIGASNLSFTANQLDNDPTASENGMKTIAIQFTFEVFINEVHEMRPKQNFTLLVGDETYSPDNVNVLEITGLEEDQWLYGSQEGKIEAIIDFVVPDHVDSFDLLFTSKFLGNGILVKFDESRSKEK